MTTLNRYDRLEQRFSKEADKLGYQTLVFHYKRGMHGAAIGMCPNGIKACLTRLIQDVPELREHIEEVLDKTPKQQKLKLAI
jgi:hypothetical protein